MKSITHSTPTESSARPSAENAFVLFNIVNERAECSGEEGKDPYLLLRLRLFNRSQAKIALTLNERVRNEREKNKTRSLVGVLSEQRTHISSFSRSVDECLPAGVVARLVHCN